jgi:hypothetical protein
MRGNVLGPAHTPALEKQDDADEAVDAVHLKRKLRAES